MVKLVNRHVALLVAIVFSGSSICLATEPAGSETGSAEMALGQGGEGEINLLPEDVGQVDDEDLFGAEGGYFHPYISLDFEYTDNLYNVDEGDTENLLTQISPGIWFALPRKKIIPITITPHNTSPGGLQMQLEDYEGTDRFQAYALGGLDFKYYSEDSDLNTTDWIMEGMGRYNMRGGLALQLLDRYTHGEDQLEIGSITRGQQRSFDSNFFMATADWDITEKIRVQGDYFNFMLAYDDDINQFLDRVDNGFNLYAYYNYSLKTSFFAEYKFVDVAYDETTEFDNNSSFIYGGIKWDTTEKVSLLAKIGYQMKTYDDHSLGQEDFDGIAFDVQFNYRYSEKTSLEFDIYRTNEETDNYLASDKTVIGSALKYTQKFTDKFHGILSVIYEDADYSNLSALTEDDREDMTISIKPAAQYIMREWLMFELAYQYELRNSNDDYFDYESNTVFLNANVSL